MEITLKINGVEVPLTEEQIKLIEDAKSKEEDKEKSPFNKVKEGNVYYYVTETGNVIASREHGLHLDVGCHATANYYTDRELAKKFAAHDELRRLLRKFNYENGWDDEVWENGGTGWDVHYDYTTKTFEVDWDTWQTMGTIFFASMERAELAIKEVIKPYIREHKEFFPGIEVEE